MVRVNEQYVIDVDERNYTVKLDKHKTDKKGNPIYDVCGYYGTLETAIKGVIGSMNKSKLSQGTHTLEEAVKIVCENNKQFEEMLERAVHIEQSKR